MMMKQTVLRIVLALVVSFSIFSPAKAKGFTIKSHDKNTALMEMSTVTANVFGSSLNLNLCIDPLKVYSSVNAAISDMLFQPILGLCDDNDDVFNRATSAVCGKGHVPHGVTTHVQGRPGGRPIQNGKWVYGDDDDKHVVWRGMGRCWHKVVLEGEGNDIKCDWQPMGQTFDWNEEVSVSMNTSMGMKTFSKTLRELANDANERIECRVETISSNFGWDTVM